MVEIESRKGDRLSKERRFHQILHKLVLSPERSPLLLETFYLRRSTEKPESGKSEKFSARLEHQRGAKGHQWMEAEFEERDRYFESRALAVSLQQCDIRLASGAQKLISPVLPHQHSDILIIQSSSFIQCKSPTKEEEEVVRASAKVRT